LWNWKIGNVEIGFGQKTELTLPVGFHNVSLDVRDSEGDTQTSYTNITVRPYGFPVLKSIDPTSGNIAGGDTITLIGQGFNFSASQTSVHFGGKASVTGSSAITVKNFNTLEVVTPKGIVAGLLDVSVVTPIGRSNTIGFTYIDGTAVTYKPYKDLYLIGGGPTAVVFGPDERLYIATQAGDVVRLTLDENYQIVDELVSKVIGKSEPPYRVILGLAFDPMDTKEVSVRLHMMNRSSIAGSHSYTCRPLVSRYLCRAQLSIPQARPRKQLQWKSLNTRRSKP
jgi:hypothetical protein